MGKYKNCDKFSEDPAKERSGLEMVSVCYVRETFVGAAGIDVKENEQEDEKQEEEVMKKRKYKVVSPSIKRPRQGKGGHRAVPFQ